jgi:MoxR-like ATPase
MGIYHFSPALRAFADLAKARMLAGRGATLLLEGPPGGGKTAFSKAIASELGGKVYYYSGAPDRERDLLYEVDVDGVLRRQAGWTPGPAWEAFEASARGEPAVLLIDEVDKTSPGFDAFMLRLLEQYAFRAPGGKEVRANPAHLIVVLTSNGRRTLRPEVIRRCQRVFVPLPENDRLKAIVRQIAEWEVPTPILDLMIRIGDLVRKDEEEAAPSPKELALLCGDLRVLASSGVLFYDDVVMREVAASYLTKHGDRAGHLDRVTKFRWAVALRNEMVKAA